MGLPGLSLTQQQTQFSMWALMNAPLIAGNNLEKMGSEVLSILTNRDVIALNQDSLTVQGQRVQYPPTPAALDFTYVYVARIKCTVNSCTWYHWYEYGVHRYSGPRASFTLNGHVSADVYGDALVLWQQEAWAKPLAGHVAQQRTAISVSMAVHIEKLSESPS